MTFIKFTYYFHISPIFGPKSMSSLLNTSDVLGLNPNNVGSADQDLKHKHSVDSAAANLLLPWVRACYRAKQRSRLHQWWDNACLEYSQYGIQ